jgi:putative SOS response-associated peptidase YedK
MHAAADPDKAIAGWADEVDEIPTDEPYTALEADGERRLDVLRLGLVLWRSKDIRGAARMINARAETLATKPAYRDALEKRPLHHARRWGPTNGPDSTAAGRAAVLHPPCRR